VKGFVTPLRLRSLSLAWQAGMDLDGGRLFQVRGWNRSLSWGDCVSIWSLARYGAVRKGSRRTGIAPSRRRVATEPPPAKGEWLYDVVARLAHKRRTDTMLLIRDIMYCKPGQARPWSRSS